ncbi:MAG: hypothetical protein ACRECW_01655 [Phyllobacterium sp.]
MTKRDRRERVGVFAHGCRLLAFLHRQRRNHVLLGLFLLVFLSMGLSPFHPPQAMAGNHSQHVIDASGTPAHQGGQGQSHHNKAKSIASCPMTSCSPASLPHMEVPHFRTGRASTYRIVTAALTGHIPDAELRPPISFLS